MNQRLSPDSVKKLSDARIRMRKLHFKVPGSAEIESVRLPFGIGVNTEHFRFEKYQFGKEFEIRAGYQRDSNPNRQTILSPGYQATDRFRDAGSGRRVHIKLWTVYTDRDRLDSRQVIQRVHYLADNGRGMFLACAFVHPEQQCAIRDSAKKLHKSSEDVSWLIPCGGIIGCGVLDTLWHGNPIAGRSLIARDLGIKGEEWKQWPRDQVIGKMRIAWASRFAIDLPYQGLGIGTIIARHLKKVARLFHAPAADFVEVITTTTKNSRKGGKPDFLERAGYVRLQETMKSGSLMVMDQSTGYRIARPAVKNYYFADLRHE